MLGRAEGRREEVTRGGDAVQSIRARAQPENEKQDYEGGSEEAGLAQDL